MLSLRDIGNYLGFRLGNVSRALSQLNEQVSHHLQGRLSNRAFTIARLT